MVKTKGAEQPELAVTSRAERGTQQAKRLRQNGSVPGVVYGKDMKPLTVSVNQRELVKLLHSKAGEHALITLRLDGPKAQKKPAMVHAVQHDPVDGHVVHIDFHTIVLTEELKVKVPLLLKGEPIGVKEEGGILEHFLREVEVECLPTDIPEQIEYDVSAMKVGETIHVRDLPPPPKAKVITDTDSPVASVQTPKAEKEEPEAETAAEPEVITEKKEEGEGPAEGGEAKGEKAKGEKAARPGGAGESKKPDEGKKE